MFYISAKLLPITKQVELIDKYEFVRAALNETSKIFGIHILALKALEPAIHPSWTYLLAALQQNKTFIQILPEYANYADVFFIHLMIKLSEITSINKHAIELFESKQPSYRLIYIVNPVDLETLKIYIKTYLKTGFICLCKSSASASISFYKKPNGSFYFCVDY